MHKNQTPQFDGTITAMAAWNRLPTRDEIEALHADPRLMTETITPNLIRGLVMWKQPCDLASDHDD